MAKFVRGNYTPRKGEYFDPEFGWTNDKGDYLGGLVANPSTEQRIGENNPYSNTTINKQFAKVQENKKAAQVNAEQKLNAPDWYALRSDLTVDEFANELNNLSAEDQAAVNEVTIGTKHSFVDMKTGMYDAVVRNKKLDETEKEERGILNVEAKEEVKKEGGDAADTSISSGKVDAAGKLATIAASAAGDESGQIVGNMATGASAGFAMGGPYGAAAGAVIGAFAGVMGARASRRKEEEAQKEKLRIEAEEKKEKEKDRRLRRLESKQRADTQSYQILQQAISSALSKDTRVRIRT